MARLNVLGPASASLTALGPWYPQVSPDGRRVAFGETVIDSNMWSPICEGGLGQPLDHVKVVSAQNGATIGLVSSHASLWTPSWLPDGRLLVFAPYNVTTAQVGYGNAGQAPTGWFSDPKENPNAFPPRQYISDGEVSRDGRQIAYVRGENTSVPRELPTIEIAAVASLSLTPVVRCDIRISHPPAENPTWSPDSRSLAWSEKDGVHVTRIAPGTGACGASPRLIVPGGLHPDWGPYSGSTPGPRIAVATSITRTTLLRSGITARVTCTSACRIDGSLILVAPRSPTLWRGTVRLRRTGTARLQVRLTKAAGGRVKRGAKLQLRVRAQPGGTSTATIQVR